MNTLDCIAKRVSVRSFDGRQVPEEMLQRILAAASAAPVASGQYDSLHLTVVQDEALLERITAATSNSVSALLGFRREMDFGARTLIFISAAPGMMPGIEYANAGCVAENMLLAATDLGLASLVWGGACAAAAKDDDLLSDLCIPEGFKPLLCVSLGYAAEPQSARQHSISVSRV